MPPPRTIVVPIDFSACSMRALEYACELASICDATIHLVHAIGPMLAGVPASEMSRDDLVDEHVDTLDQVAREHQPVRFGSPIVDVADPREMILDAVQTLGADLIVLGMHGPRGASRLVLGSVAGDIVRRAECAVLTIRGPAP